MRRLKYKRGKNTFTRRNETYEEEKVVTYS